MTALEMFNRRDGEHPDTVRAIERAAFVYLADGSPLHLRSVLKGGAAFDALVRVLSNGGVVAASGAGATVLCDPMVDPRGGAYTVGLGIVQGLAVFPYHGTAADHMRERSIELLPARGGARRSRRVHRARSQRCGRVGGDRSRHGDAVPQGCRARKAHRRRRDDVARVAQVVVVVAVAGRRRRLLADRHLVDVERHGTLLRGRVRRILILLYNDPSFSTTSIPSVTEPSDEYRYGGPPRFFAPSSVRTTKNCDPPLFGSGVRHRHRPGFVAIRRGLVGQLVARTAGAVAVGVATLKHEVLRRLDGTSARRRNPSREEHETVGVLRRVLRVERDRRNRHTSSRASPCTSWPDRSPSRAHSGMSARPSSPEPCRCSPRAT